MATSGRQDGGPQAGLSAGIQVDEAVTTAWDQLRNTSEVSWIFLTLDPKAKPHPTLKLREEAPTGTGSIDDFIASFKSDQVNWVGVKVGGKFYGLVCPGEDVGGMAKSKQMMVKNGVMNSLEGKSGEISCENGISEVKEKVSAHGEIG